MKKCNRCNQEKPKSDFFLNSKRSDGIQTYCKPCHLEYGRERYANPEAFERRKMNRDLYKERRKQSSRKWYLKSTHNITEDQYAKLFNEGSEQCWICKQFTEYSLNVDHNHQTGQIRGLLCGKCNRALGLFQDNKNIIRAAAKYLESFENEDK
jgi:hypothetical protein